MLQAKKTRCKQKRNTANKKDTLQIKNERRKQKKYAANKKRTLQIKEYTSCARTRPKRLDSL